MNFQVGWVPPSPASTMFPAASAGDVSLAQNDSFSVTTLLARLSHFYSPGEGLRSGAKTNRVFSKEVARALKVEVRWGGLGV